MKNELVHQREQALQSMMNVEVAPVTPEIQFEMRNAMKIHLSELSTLGVAFQPVVSFAQVAMNGSGGSGIYFVNTMGKQMFHAQGSTDFIGSLMASNGGVGGGQARMTALPCDPTMLFLSLVLIQVERKLDVIQQTQQEILQFLEEKERATLQGNFNVLGEVLSQLKYNWDNEQYKVNKHILVQQIKKEAEGSILLYRSQIGQRLQKRSFLHRDLEAKNTQNKLQSQLQDYQLALYLYAYSAFLEVVLLGNFNEGYLESVEQRITEYSYQYRKLYTDCYNLMEACYRSSLQMGIRHGLSAASKVMGQAIAKVPVVSNGTLDEKLIYAGNKLESDGTQKTNTVLSQLAQVRKNVTIPFVEQIRAVNDLYNKPIRCMVADECIYIQPYAG